MLSFSGFAEAHYQFMQLRASRLSILAGLSTADLALAAHKDCDVLWKQLNGGIWFPGQMSC